VMKLVSINIRGLRGDVKWKYLKELIGKENPRVIFIQETKLVVLNDYKCYNAWVTNDISWIHRGVNNEGGGILTMWDNKIFSCCRTEEGKGFILIEGDYKGVGSSQAVRVVLVNVYAPCFDRDKEVL